jgi:hypothetical protein
MVRSSSARVGRSSSSTALLGVVPTKRGRGWRRKRGRASKGYLYRKKNVEREREREVDEGGSVTGKW